MSHLHKSVIANGVGGPEVLRVIERAVPQPQAGQVLIKVAAAGINRPDIMQREGRYPPPKDVDPAIADILGLEVSGTIVALGGADGNWQIGDKVCALLAAGGYAEYAVADADLCLPVPRGFSLQQAASLPEVAFTAYANIIEHGALKAGETLLIHGGSGGIGSFGIQLAKAWGARVIATVGSEDKAEFCRNLGADCVINYRSEDFVARVKDFTGGRGVDVVLDMIGGDYVARNIDCLAFGGRHVSIAAQKGDAILNMFKIMQKQLLLTGSVMRARSAQEKARLAQQLKARVWPLIEQGKIKPVIDKVFALNDVRAAHDYMESSAHKGKILLVP